MRYAFLVETYATERLKVLSVWSEFHDEDLWCVHMQRTAVAAACTSRWCISV